MPPAAGRFSGAAGTLGLVVEKARGGARIVQISCLCSSMASARSTVVRVLMPCCGATVVALRHFMNDITLWVIPIASAFACIMCHTLDGDRNGRSSAGAPGRGGISTPEVLKPSKDLGCLQATLVSWVGGAIVTLPCRPPALPQHRSVSIILVASRLCPVAGPTRCPLQRRGPSRPLASASRRTG